MEADMITMKLAFADIATKLQSNYKERAPVTQPAPPVIVKPSHAATASGPACPVLIADYAEGAKPADRVSLAAADQMLGAGQNGPTPQRVRQMGDRLYINLQNTADYERAKDIMERKPECATMFKSVSKSDVLYPAVLLFVDLSYLPSLNEELIVAG